MTRRGEKVDKDVDFVICRYPLPYHVKLVIV